MKSNFVVILIVLALGVYVGLRVNDGESMGSSSENTSTTSSEKQTQNDTTPAKVEEIGIKEVLNVGDVLFRVEEVSSRESISDGFSKYKADGTFLIVTVSLKNVGNQAITTDASFFEIQLGDKRYSPSTLLTVDGQFMYDGLNPDIQKSGRIFFDVPVDVAKSKDLILNVQTGFWGTEQGKIHLR